MQLHDYSPNPGAKRRIKRLGCGESSGHGKTACKGHKGQKARSGSGTRVGFEGGQMPLHRRLPKRGFNNHDFRTFNGVVNVGDLDARFEAGALINEESLRKSGLLNGRCDAVKLLADGEVEKAFTIEVNKISPAAKAKIEKAGGTVTIKA
ncbi:MAG: 50S ribosomal protein L15 [Luteolibacter sp.]